MYELSLTALIESKDFPAACSVLSGLCGMPSWQTVHRVLYFQGPVKPTGLSNLSSIEKPVRKDIGYLWKELHQSLVRQSFILQARYEVLKQRDFGDQAAPMDLNSKQGVLRWTDFPDPPHGRPILIQRKKHELWDQKKLLSLMKDNNYQYVVW